MPHDSKKSPLYQVLNILRDGRLDTPGKRTSVVIKLQDFGPAISFLPTELSEAKKIDALGGVIRSLTKEKKEDGKFLIEVSNFDTLKMFSKSYVANKEVDFLFSREDLDNYISYLINGDKIRHNAIRTGFWFNKKTGTMEHGKIPSATQMGQDIQKITVIKPEIADDPVRVAVNDDYENLIEIKPEQKFWKVIVTLSNNESLPHMTHNDSKYVVDYSVNKNHILYSKGLFNPTKLFKISSGDLLPVIEIEKTISTRTLKQRQTKQRKRA